MKKIFLFCITFTLGLSIVKAEPFHFLPYSEFQRLSNSEKLTYIGAVRDISLQIENHLSLSSSSKSRWSLLINNLMKEAEAAPHLETSWDSQVPKSYLSTSNLPEESGRIFHALELITGHLDFYFDHNRHWETTGTQQNILDRLPGIIQRLEAMSSKNLDPQLEKDNRMSLLKLSRVFRLAKSVLPELIKYENRVDQLTVSLVNSIEELAPEKNSKTRIKKNKSPAVASKVATAPARAPYAILNQYECIYAGFVIKEKKCPAPTQLPKGFSVAGITNDTFNCAMGEGPVLCNPLVFGYKVNGGAYCVSKHQDASKNCSETSNKTDNQARILALWSNPENQNAIVQYQDDLNRVCDKKFQKIADVLKTCDVVQPIFNKKMEEAFAVVHNSTGAVSNPALPKTDVQRKQ